MKYLLDTHALLWAIVEPKQLSAKARQLIKAPENQILVSTISFWEISLKSALGKLILENVSPEDFPNLCAEMNIDIVSLDAVSSSTYHHLRATYHRDPFDRMLIWQAKHLQTPIISRDKTVKLYESEGIHVVW